MPLLLRLIALLTPLALSACAAGTNTAARAPETLTAHACQPKETVGFSCELHDGRLLSLCASPGFNNFKGKPTANPGYAYVAIGSAQGKALYTYPSNPLDYKKHMYYWVSISAAPHMFVSTPKGPFIHLSLDIEAPADATPQYAPEGWPLASSENASICASQINRDHLDPFMAQMVKKADWEKARQAEAPQSSTGR